MFAFGGGGTSMRLAGWSRDDDDEEEEVIVEPAVVAPPEASQVLPAATLPPVSVKAVEPPPPVRAPPSGPVPAPQPQQQAAAFSDPRQPALANPGVRTNVAFADPEVVSNHRTYGSSDSINGSQQRAAQPAARASSPDKAAVLSNFRTFGSIEQVAGAFANPPAGSRPAQYQQQQQVPLANGSLGRNPPAASTSTLKDVSMSGVLSDRPRSSQRNGGGGGSGGGRPRHLENAMSTDESSFMYGSGGSSIALSRSGSRDLVYSDDDGGYRSSTDNPPLSSRRRNSSGARSGSANGASVSSIIQSTVGLLPEDMSVADVVQQLGAANGWSEDEVLQDTKELMRNRLRTVRDLRRMTAQGWSELSSLLPVVKDLLRQAIQ